MSLNRVMLAASLATLGACVSPPPAGPQQVDFTPRLTPAQPDTRASFECSGALPAVHRQICADDELARQDKALAESVRALFQRGDLVGALVLEANQRQWQLSRAQQCGLGEENGTDMTPNPQAIFCLKRMYQQRAGQLAVWASAQPAGPDKPNPWTHYVKVQVAEDRSNGSCTAIADALNQGLAANGRLSLARLPGAELLAGSQAANRRVSLNGQQFSVELHNAGSHAGHQQRARGVLLNGQVLVDDRLLPRWVSEQPNYGGRAHASSSQTGDYASLDIYRLGEETLLLANETWGYYSPAARGESAYAGLYRLGSEVSPRCLFRTYLTPPRGDTLRGLPRYAALDAELTALAGDPLPGYSQQDRRDAFERWKERQWTLLNLPLLGVDALGRYGRQAALHARHDAALESFFQWSERNLDNKQQYRRLMPMLQPAHQELVTMFAAQGLDAQQAASAADLLFHETLARTMENLQTPEQAPALPPAAASRYSPRYAIAPPAGALEQGRSFATLYSVVLNDAPLPVIRDFITYETEELGSRSGMGADGNTALMAAVNNPQAIELLLQQGFAVNAGNHWGKTALMHAVQAGQLESVRLLLQAGADVHAQTRPTPGAGAGGSDRKEAAAPRQTALLMAASQASEPLIDTLLAAGAARAAWEGYAQQVCQQLQNNPLLSAAQRDRYQRSTLCQGTTGR